jgi:hypothetical protein
MRSIRGPAPKVSLGGSRYYATFTDDKTRITSIYFLQFKDDTGDAYSDFEAWAKMQKNTRIKVLHTEPNGVAEARNRAILVRIRALLHASGLPRTLWAEAARHAVWLMNRTRVVDGMTPYEAVFERKPDLRDVRDWGEVLWVRVKGGGKLGGRVREARWLGLSDGGVKGTRVYYPDTGTVGVERSVWLNKSEAAHQST